MPDRLKLTVVSPERALVDAEVDEVQLPGLGGYFGVLPGHAPLFSELSIGRLSYTLEGQMESLAIAGGFVEVLDDRVRVLARVAESEQDIDVERAREALKRAQDRMSSGDGGIDYERALAAGHRAASRLHVAGTGE